MSPAPGPPRAAVLAVGSELLLGDVVNSNAAEIGQRLRDCGVQVVTSEALPDDHKRLVAAVRRCLVDHDVVVLCGGLGPTVDDLTREAVAVACDAPLARDEAVRERLEQRFGVIGEDVRLGRVPPEVWRQADVPRGAEPLPNPAGTAPGLWLERDGRVVVALPGPPRELAAVGKAVWSRLAARFGSRLVTRQLLVAGVPESVVAERAETGLVLPERVALSYLAGGAQVRVRFTGPDPAALERLVDHVAAALGDDVVSRDGAALDAVVHQLLADRGQTVAVAESLTGGGVGAALTALAGSSATFRGGLVVYATDLKGSLAGVPADVLTTHGAVSEQTARALAEGARARLGADWGIGVTGVAGPDEQEGKPVGTVLFGLAGPTGTAVEQRWLPGDRAQVRAVTATLALDLLRRRLLREA